VKAFIRSKLGRRFLGMFVLLLLPVPCLAWLGMQGASSALRRETHAVLRAASDGAEAQLREFLLFLRRTTEGFATDQAVGQALSARAGAAGWAEVLKRLRQRIPEAQEVFCLDRNGRVVAASRPELAGRDFSGSECFKLGRESFYAGDLAWDRVDGQIRWRMSAPVNESGQAAAVLVVGVDPAVLSSLTTGKRVLDEGADTQSFQIGETGETYIVNRGGYLLTQSRFARDGVLRVKVETEPVRTWRERDEEMIGDYKDYRSVPVSGASALLKEPQWLVVTEIDFSQAIAPIAHLRDMLLALVFGALLAAALLGGRFARRIVGPVEALSLADQALARGDEKEAMVSEQSLPDNEIGDFVRKRNSRIRELLDRQRELAREQKARAEAAAELQRISYSMVHDMRAPLRAVTVCGDLLAHEAGERLGESGKDYLDRMRTACLRMDRLICDMLRYSSLLNQDLPLAPTNVSELIRHLISSHPSFREKQQQIKVQAELPAVNANGPALQECLMALLDNALRYGRPGVPAQVSISAEAADDRVVIIMEDNGVGMPEPMRSKVFGIFQRGSSTQEGSGIGLALVRVAVERMGGRVGVDSEEGRGSRFWIELRRAG
jgi:signal transduction histidine kinase